MPYLSDDEEVQWRLMNKRKKPPHPNDIYFEEIEKQLPDEITLKLELLEQSILLEALKLSFYELGELPPGPNSREDIEALDRELDDDSTTLKLDHYLNKISKMMNFRVLFKAEEKACKYYERALVDHLEFLCELVGTCERLIRERRLSKETVTWVFENRIVPILIPLTKITIEKLSRCSNNPSKQSNLYYNLKIILKSLKWLTVGEIFLNENTLDQEILKQLLLEVFYPLLTKARSSMKHHLHVYKFSLNANFERHCRCSEYWYAPHLIRTLKKLSFHDPRILKFAVLQLDKVVDFSDTALDICVASLIEGGNWEEVYSFLGHQIAPMFKNGDAPKRRHQACWVFNVCLGSNSKHIQDLLLEHGAALEGLLADRCPAVRKEARIIWLKIMLVPDNQPEVARILPQIVSKILSQEDYTTLINREADLFVWEGVGGRAGLMGFNFRHWLLLPIFQRAADIETLPAQFYDNLLKYFPVGYDIDEGQESGLFSVTSYQFESLYENLVWSDSAVKAAHQHTRLAASLRLYLERPDLSTQSYGCLYNIRCDFSVQFYPDLTHYPKWVPSETMKLFELLRRMLTISDRKIDVRFAARMIFLVFHFMNMNISEQPCCGPGVRHHVESAKMLELLAIRAHQQGLQDKIDEFTFGQITRGVSDSGKRCSWGQSLQAMTVINFDKQNLRKSKYKSVHSMLEQIDFGREPQGIHNRRIILLLISKYIVDFRTDLDELKELVPMAINLCASLIFAYKMRRHQEYFYESEDCLPTCIELAFPTSFDDTTRADYQCEFSLFHDSLARIDETLMKQIVESLNPVQTLNLNCCRNSRKLVGLKESGPAQAKFQCLGHYKMLEEACEPDQCPLLSRKFERKRAEENTFVRPDPPPPQMDPKQSRSSKRHKSSG